MADYKPTEEQLDAVRAALSGGHLAIEAGAGCAKSTTLRFIAEAKDQQARRTGQRSRGVYVAFNRRVVEDAQGMFPRSVHAATAHGLAMRAVGRDYRHRLGAPRMKSADIARRAGIDPILIQTPFGAKRLAAGFLAGILMRGITNFCQSADEVPTYRHIPVPETMREDVELMASWGEVRKHLEAPLRKAWADMIDPDGTMPYQHDCQPPGTLVRKVVQYGGGISGTTITEDVPIESLRAGDRVVSYTMTQRRGYVRRAGRLVTAVGSRMHDGDLITVTTPNGRSSSYTPEHRCVVRLDCDLAGGNHVVYLAKRGANYRIGRTTWRTRSQGNALGIRRRAENQDADAMWVVSVHDTDADAALAEALTAHRHGLPTWRFRSANETMPLDQFWAEAGDNAEAASACLAAHGLNHRHPFWQRGDGWNSTRRPVVIRAANLLPGMLMLEVDEITPGAKGELHAYNGTNGWHPVAVHRAAYVGAVYNLDVDEDHTYIADGIATHNCYLKTWSLGSPDLRADYLLADESQDLWPAWLAVMEANRARTQLVVVGDENQQLYEWRSAVNAMRATDVDHRATLTTSFRFGPEVAAVANEVLDMASGSLRLIGGGPSGRVGTVSFPDLVLCRTNAMTVRYALNEVDAGGRPHIIGGASEVVSFARAAQQLQEGRDTYHPELACFDSWSDVRAYVSGDELGSELALLVKLVEDFGAARIVGAFDSMPRREAASLVVSTVHKMKGGEANAVRLAEDFPEDDDEHPVTRPELRVVYVAVTRAKRELDIDAVGMLRPARTGAW